MLHFVSYSVSWSLEIEIIVIDLHLTGSYVGQLSCPNNSVPVTGDLLLCSPHSGTRLTHPWTNSTCNVTESVHYAEFECAFRRACWVPELSRGSMSGRTGVMEEEFQGCRRIPLLEANSELMQPSFVTSLFRHSCSNGVQPCLC